MKVEEVRAQFPDMFKYVDENYPFMSAKEVAAIIITAQLASKKEASNELSQATLFMVIDDYLNEDAILKLWTSKLIEILED